MALGQVLLWRCHVNKHIVFDIVHEIGALRHFGSDLVGNIVSLSAGSLRCLLRNGRGDEDCDDTPPALGREHRRFGYRRLHILLRREGHAVNHGKLYRLYGQENLAHGASLQTDENIAPSNAGIKHLADKTKVLRLVRITDLTTPMLRFLMR
jgi:hypothetical protein